MIIWFRWAFWPACGPLRSFWLRTLGFQWFFGQRGGQTSKVIWRIPWEDCRFYWSMIFLNCMGSMSGKRYNHFIDPMGLEWVITYSMIFSIPVLLTFQGRSVEFGRCTVTLVFGHLQKVLLEVMLKIGNSFVWVLICFTLSSFFQLTSRKNSEVFILASQGGWLLFWFLSWWQGSFQQQQQQQQQEEQQHQVCSQQKNVDNFFSREKATTGVGILKGFRRKWCPRIGLSPITRHQSRWFLARKTNQSAMIFLFCWQKVLWLVQISINALFQII